MSAYNQCVTVLNASHVVTHLAEAGTVIITAIYKWGNRGQERPSNLPKVAARLSGSRVGLFAIMVYWTGWGWGAVTGPVTGADAVICEVCGGDGTRRKTQPQVTSVGVSFLFCCFPCRNSVLCS